MSEIPEEDWPGYYRATAGREPRPLFREALAGFAGAPAAGRQAIDLGCGDGTESLALLAGGWRVLALDREPAAVDTLLARVPAAHRPFLETRVAPFEAAGPLLPPADFLYAGYSLPFCRPAAFAALWQALVGALRPGGRFAGHLFGRRDSWAANPHMTFFTRAQVQSLLEGLAVKKLVETEEDGNSFDGPKHWHIFEIIADRAAAKPA